MLYNLHGHNFIKHHMLLERMPQVQVHNFHANVKFDSWTCSFSYTVYQISSTIILFEKQKRILIFGSDFITIQCPVYGCEFNKTFRTFQFMDEWTNSHQIVTAKKVCVKIWWWKRWKINPALISKCTKISLIMHLESIEPWT